MAAAGKFCLGGAGQCEGAMVWQPVACGRVLYLALVAINYSASMGREQWICRASAGKYRALLQGPAHKILRELRELQEL